MWPGNQIRTNLDTIKSIKKWLYYQNCYLASSIGIKTMIQYCNQYYGIWICCHFCSSLCYHSIISCHWICNINSSPFKQLPISAIKDHSFWQIFKLVASLIILNFTFDNYIGFVVACPKQIDFKFFSTNFLKADCLTKPLKSIPICWNQCLHTGWWDFSSFDAFSELDIFVWEGKWINVFDLVQYIHDSNVYHMSWQICIAN